MDFIVKANESRREIEPVEAGIAVARCIQIVDLGTQQFEYQGEKKEGRKVRLTWELPEVLRTFNEEKGEQPALISKEYTLSFNEKATLRKHIESWIGIKITENQFNLKDLLGKPALLNIVHIISKSSGKTVAKVEGVLKKKDSQVIADQYNKSSMFLLNNPDLDVWGSLPKFIQETIQKSPEFEEAQILMQEGMDTDVMV